MTNSSKWSTKHWATLTASVRLSSKHARNRLQSLNSSVAVGQIGLVAADNRTRANHRYKFRAIGASSTGLRYSFAVRTVSDWNQLPAVVVEQENPAAFKAKLSWPDVCLFACHDPPPPLAWYSTAILGCTGAIHLNTVFVVTTDRNNAPEDGLFNSSELHTFHANWQIILKIQIIIQRSFLSCQRTTQTRPQSPRWFIRRVWSVCAMTNFKLSSIQNSIYCMSLKTYTLGWQDKYHRN